MFYEAVSRPQVLSWSPRVTVFENFLSVRECHHLVSLARDFLEPSTVVDTETGMSSADPWRNSSSYFLSRAQEQDFIVKPIMERISVYTQTPITHGEPMQVVGATMSPASYLACCLERLFVLKRGLDLFVLEFECLEC